jgi:hypothetical protein
MLKYDAETNINTLNAELNPICHLLALLEAHHILQVGRIRVKGRNGLTVCFFGATASSGPWPPHLRGF